MQSEAVDLVPDQQGAREVDRTERAHEGRERLRRSLQDGRRDRHERKGVSRPEYGRASSGDIVIVESEHDARSVDRPKTLHPDELARDGLFDLRPRRQAIRLREDDAKENRRVDVRVHRACRSSASSSPERMRQFAGE
ncbi:MAG TPA: hypothetical protein VM344_01325 [Vitreimonas sp.]|nr:hypothetical protein [Vitreimonas sp.]